LRAMRAVTAEFAPAAPENSASETKHETRTADNAANQKAG
jgi:hypothetical protein